MSFVREERVHAFVSAADLGATRVVQVDVPVNLVDSPSLVEAVDGQAAAERVERGAYHLGLAGLDDFGRAVAVPVG